MKTYSLNSKQTLPISLEKAWHFFSRPENLNELTPQDMSFEIKSDIQGVEMYEGMLIEYTIKPMMNIPMNWVTEITHILDKKYFIDEQRFGPYAMWHHEHHFEETEGGVLMTDKLTYAMPMGPLGTIANGLFVGKRVKEIFDYRYSILETYFS